MILRTIKCNISGCNAVYTEAGFNAGFPGWGSISGICDPDTGADQAHLCPYHLNAVIKILNGVHTNGME